MNNWHHEEIFKRRRKVYDTFTLILHILIMYVNKEIIWGKN